MTNEETLSLDELFDFIEDPAFYVDTEDEELRGIVKETVADLVKFLRDEISKKFIESKNPDEYRLQLSLVIAKLEAVVGRSKRRMAEGALKDFQTEHGT